MMYVIVKFNTVIIISLSPYSTHSFHIIREMINFWCRSLSRRL